MTYATRDDLVAAYGEDAVVRLSVRDEDPDGAQAVARGLAHADGVIDAKLSVRFTLPLPTVPTVIATIAADLAVARMATTADLMTDEVTRREKNARRDLEEIATGRMNLGLPSAGPSDLPRPILGPGGQKLFTRDSLRGV